MELGDLEVTREAYQATKEKEAQEEQGEDVTLMLMVPEHGERAHKFKIGVTVAYVKMIVQQEYGLPMSTVVLKLKGKPLIDPLSLCDCPGIAPGQEVRVEVSTL